MTCRIERPAPQDLFNRYLQMFSNSVLGGAAVIPESNEWYATSINYAIAEEFYAISEQAWKSRDPREACCADLVELAALDGVYPLAAVAAQGFVKLTGTVGASIPTVLDFTIGGLQFTSASETGQPSEIPVGGTAVIRVRALVPGAAGNISTATGSLTTVAPGINASVEVCGNTFCNGSDAEECEAFRIRYLARLQYQPRATIAWILGKLLEWPCATRAFQRAGNCCECSDCADRPSECADCGCADCGGKLNFYLMFDNTFPSGVAPASVIREAEEWLFGAVQGYGLGQVEIGVCGRIVPVVCFNVDVVIDIADCATTLQLKNIREQVQELFTTLQPSVNLTTRMIDALVSNIMGASVDISTRYVVSDADAYGGINNEYGGFTEGDKVFVTSCGDLEPECDFLPCLGTITITRSGNEVISCP